MTPIQNKVLEVSRAIYDKNCLGTKHFTFITLRNKILSIGINSRKTDPFSFKNNYAYPTLHSEFSSVKKFRGDREIFKKSKLYNIRINSLGIIGYSRPCKYCIPWLVLLNFRKIYYTDYFGNFTLFDPSSYSSHSSI